MVTNISNPLDEMISTKDDFIRYIACFNNKDYEPQHAFYGDNVTLKLPTIPALEGSEGIKKHYDFIHGLADETLDIKLCLFDKEPNPSVIFFENNSWFRFKRDHEAQDPCPGKKGDLVNINTWIIYTLNPDQTFKSISCLAANITNMGPVDIPPVEPGHLRPY